MLLKSLISTAITNEHISKIEIFLDEAQFSEFDSTLIDHCFSHTDFAEFVHWMKTECTTFVSFDCEEENEEGNAASENDFCMYCGKQLKDVHSYEIMYKFPYSQVEALRQEIAQFFEEKYLMPHYQQNFEILKKERDSIVPFLGSGISVPVGLPNWKGLLKELNPIFDKDFHREMYNEYLETGDLLEALDHLKKKSTNINTDDQLKDVIIDIIEKKLRKDVDEKKHNFYDIIKLNSNLYITTNYDLCLEMFLSNSLGYRPPLSLKDIDNLRKLLQEEGQVLHIHGYLKRKDTMIVSQDDYKKLYDDEGLMFKVNSILSSRPLLYIGFSFTDKFFVDLYTRLGKIVKNHHYIVIANPTPDVAREFNKQNIKVLGLNVALKADGSTDYDDYIFAFRKLIEYIMK